jgi:5-methylcytosine-specific restriction endonuclease McrA
VLTRDLYTCQHTGVILVGGKDRPNSAVVYHKIPHRGDERLFWNINNLEAVSSNDTTVRRRRRNEPV